MSLALVMILVLAGLPAIAQAEEETPSVSLDPCPEYANVNNVTFTGTATHDNSPIASVEYRVDGGLWDEATPVDGQFGDSTTEGYGFTIGNLDDGWHTVDVGATTKAGYTTAPADYATAVFCVDTVAPTIAITPLSPDPSGDNTPTLVGVAQDLSSPIAAVEYRVDGGDWTAALAVDGTFDSISENYTFTTAPLADGPHTVQARARDSAGNISASAGDDFTIDTTAPSLVQEAVSSYINTPTVVFSGTATDAVSPVASVDYCTDSGPWIEATAPDGAFDEPTEEYAFTAADLDDGSHTITVRATDGLGNTTGASDYLSSCFIVDTTAPGVLLAPLGSDPVNDNSPSFNGSASDASTPVAVVQYRIDGGDWVAAGAADGAFDGLSEDVSFAAAELCDGAHFVELMAIDAVGNVSALAGLCFTIDTIAPLASIDDIPDSVSQLTDIGGTASDIPPGEIEKVQVVIGRESDGAFWDGSTWVESVRWLDTVGVVNWSYPMPTVVDGQSYTINAVSVDTAGNSSMEATESFAVVVTGPADADPPATPGTLDPGEEADSENSSSLWLWFLISGLGIFMLMAVLMARKLRKRDSGVR